MKIRLAAFAAAVMILTALFAGGAERASAATAAPTLTVGTYNVSLYVANVTQTAGTQCSFSQGDYNGWFLYYPGVGKTGAIFRLQAPTSTNSYVVIVDLPTAPAKGVTSWTGSYTSTVGPGAISSWTGSFTQTINVVDAYSFGGTLTITNWPYPGSHGADQCTVTFESSYVWSGAGG